MTRQKLGQHFLKNPEILKKIVEASHAQKKEIVLEVGGGHGELTETLLQKNPDLNILVIEKDPVLAGLLQEKYKSNPNVKIIEDDVRKFLFDKNINKHVKNNSWKLVGNIPYYLTGYLLRLVSELKHKPSRSVLMMQKEVGERILGKAPHYNKLAASVDFWADTKFILGVPRKDFSPPPEVDSVVLSFDLKTSSGKKNMIEKKYYKTVSAVFSQPRKTILNNLAHSLKSDRKKILETIQSMKLSPEMRPQNLSHEDIVALAKLF